MLGGRLGVFFGIRTYLLWLIVVAVVLAVMSRSMLSRGRFMPKSVDTLKENAEWLRARTES